MILAGDIGGTRARLQLLNVDDAGRAGRVVKQDVFESRAYKSLEDVVRAFLEGATERKGGRGQRVGAKTKAPRIDAASFGIAGPVIDQKVTATNFPWVVDAKQVAKRLGIGKVTLLNDLVSLAFGALTVPPKKLHVLQAGAPKRQGGTLAVIAAGTGLGEAGLVWDGERHVPLATEGGHTDLAAQSPLEWELFEWLQRRFGHVSYERIVAGPGFSTLYEFFRDVKKMEERRELTELLADAPDRNAMVAELGSTGRSEVAYHAVQLFARIYGAEAGNLALKTLSTAGVYVAGGIAANLVDTLSRGPFLEGFLAKGRFRAMLETFPVAIVLDADIGLAGSAYHAARALREGAPRARVATKGAKAATTRATATRPAKKRAAPRQG